MPPLLRASSEAEIGVAARVAERNPTRNQRRREGAVASAADSLAFLVGSAAGRRFLDSPAPRALARGDPAESCPAVAAAAAPTTAAAVGAALSQCLAALPGERRAACGCRVLAYDGVAAVSRDDLAYATGVSARLHAPALGIDGLFVAEEQDDTGRLLIRDLDGVVGRIENTGPGRARIVLDGVGAFEGRREAVGFRRGRLAERIYAEDGRGRRLSLLIGFGPQELASRAGAWLAWPRSG